MARTAGGMTISALSSVSTIPLSTIKFYIRAKLLPRPRKAKGTKAYYDSSHLQRLRLIRKIQDDGNVPLSKIKEILDLMDDGQRSSEGGNGSAAAELRREIVTRAIDVFRKKGYEGATIGDIVAAGRIGRSTFYKHFKDKKGLFIECIKHIIFTEIGERGSDAAEEIAKETDSVAVFETRAKAYYNVNPLWRDMVEILRAAAINHPGEFADSLDEVVHLKIDMLKRSIEQGVRRGVFRKINATLMTVMMLGLQDYHRYLTKVLKEKTMEDMYEDAKDIILYGVLKR